MNALILFSYSHIQSLDDIPTFYHHLSHGRATDTMVERGDRLFRSLGTPDPLTTVTRRIGRALVWRLRRETKEEWRYYIGSKHTPPFVEEAVQSCLEDGANKILTLSLTPLYSKTGAKLYERIVVNTIKKSGIENVKLIHIPAYFNHPSFINLMARRLHEAINWLPKEMRHCAEVIFTSHSMPGNEKSQQAFIKQYNFLAGKIAERVGITSYQLAYRSASPGPQEWLEPDVLDVIKHTAKEGKKAVIISELLSIIANAEAIKEIGSDAQSCAHEHHMEFVQTEYLNDSNEFIEFLLQHIQAYL